MHNIGIGFGIGIGLGYVHFSLSLFSLYVYLLLFKGLSGVQDAPFSAAKSASVQQEVQPKSAAKGKDSQGKGQACPFPWESFPFAALFGWTSC